MIISSVSEGAKIIHINLRNHHDYIYHTTKLNKCLSSENRQNFLNYVIFLEYESFCIYNLHTDISLEMYAFAHILEFKNILNIHSTNVVPDEHMQNDADHVTSDIHLFGIKLLALRHILSLESCMFTIL